MRPNCIDQVAEHWKNQNLLDPVIIDEIIDDLRLKAGDDYLAFKSDEEKLRKAIDKKKYETQLEHFRAKRTRYLNELRSIQFFEYAKGFGPDKIHQALFAFMRGDTSNRVGAGASIDKKQKALLNEILSGMNYEIKRAGLSQHMESKVFDLDIAKELWEIGRKDGKPGASGNKAAKELAKIINKYQHMVVDRMNDAGAYIEKLPGYIVTQTHSAKKIRKQGKDAWVTYMADNLDIEKSFGDVTDAELKLILDDLYHDLSTGNFNSIKGDGSIEVRGGISNLAKRVSQQRKLHFKSADSWYNYNSVYGASGMMEALSRGFEVGTRNISLMEAFGPNPDRGFAEILERAEVYLKLNDPDTHAKFVSNRKKLQATYDTIAGKGEIGVDNMASKATQVALWIQNTSKLGMAAISQLADLGVMPAVMRTTGVSYLEAQGKALGGLFKGKRGAEKRALAESFGVAVDVWTGEIANRVTAVHNDMNWISTSTNWFFKWNGMNWMTQTNKSTAGLMFSNWMGQNKGKAFDALDLETRQTLERYNIDGAKWELMRNTIGTADDGRNYLDPRAIKDITNDAIEALVRNTGDTDAL
jgi:hypothetical protein